jgi:hypothetical protein
VNRNLVIATSADGGFYNTGQFQTNGFDLALVNFNPDGWEDFSHVQESAKYYVVDKGFKHHIYKRFIEKYDILDQYDWIWMPDYDVHLDATEIDRLFRIAQDYNLNICQPSLTHDSYHSFPLVLNDPTKLLRYTNYVEIMCPLFKTDVLKKVLGTFTVTYSGWAQDFLWARDLNYERLAIIDDVQARHVKPIESQYWVLPNGLNADQELEHVIKLMGLEKDVFWPKTIGGINRCP